MKDRREYEIGGPGRLQIFQRIGGRKLGDVVDYVE